ncbi:hypothetical protein HYPSUDRAFT_126636 [Hypholoma sublateritium FD-334 SS-4]|uniref:Amidohydrolase-related domain-containing protein n=1 Tax=Hypholoma sublateritium (strain FD-334 SS-4) TaxID=945553 RepID=A0A0D2LP62_HYPSF|nr:hypothetical protein HYPSUDRAFT_126636 [Hypholoma sublateritium FD-334 SS-4]
MSSPNHELGEKSPSHRPYALNLRQYRFSTLAICLSIAAATTLLVYLPIQWGLVGALPGPNFSVRQEPYHNPFVFDATAKGIVLSRCAEFRATPIPPHAFHLREKSDRYESSTNATLIRNGVIFTGKDNGTDIVRGDILLDKGVIRGLGKISRRVLDSIENLATVDAKGGWVTPGLVDLHTHLGVLSTPILAGAIDFNSAKGPILPYLRTIDGLNTHDAAYELAMAGGVTSAQILPGSSNAIGGQAFMIKLRKPRDRSASSMLIEPPYNLRLPDSDDPGDDAPFRWRYLKQACGENLIGYGNRMDSMWSYRSAYAEALKIKLAQDQYCARAEEGLWDMLDGPLPDDPRWEMLVDVLRGKVKISSHCYEAVDLDAMVRLSNEFQFNIASIHHASEAYLVPSLLKQMWGGVSSVAIFATNHRYKREAFRGSEFAARILADEGIPVVMKSDHPVINSRYLIYEAQQAHYFGLPPGLALAAVTSTPAATAGLSHRIGVLEEGFDADVVLWDSHPLQLGATPRKVWIDGILQIPVPLKSGEENHVQIGRGKEGDKWQQVPDTPNWDLERNLTIAWEGLPPLEGRNTEKTILFTNVKEVWQSSLNGRTARIFAARQNSGRADNSELGSVLVGEGKIICAGYACANVRIDAVTKDLCGGSISPGLMTFGSPIGLEEIASEPSTADGKSYDAFSQDVPRIMGDSGAVVRAMDGLMFGTRNALTAYRSGVTLAISSLARPIYLSGPDAHIISGLSVVFRTGAAHSMQRGAVIQEVAALHVVMGNPYPTSRGVSVSTQIAAIRRLLYGWESTETETGAWFKKAAEGVVPLVIEVDSLDIMANLLRLKLDVEDKIGSRMRMVFSGATEAHLLAKEISDADVGVILNPIRSFPMAWDQRRILPGPPLTNDTALVTLLSHGVVVGLGIRSAWEARNTRFDVKWAALESNGRISDEEAYTLVTDNLVDLLGIRGIGDDMNDLVAFEGGSMFDLASKPIAVISPVRGSVDFF